MRKLSIVLLAVTGLLFTVYSNFAQADALADRINAALASPQRSAKERARDAARKPVQVMEFLGIKAGMTAVDIVAGAGWYDDVLSAAVGPTGTVYSQNPDFFKKRLGKELKARAKRLGNVKLLFTKNMTDFGLDGVADFAITALNTHDFYNSGGLKAGLDFFKGAYKALKPGGILGVIDHVGIAGRNNKKLHRIPIAVERKLITDSGFVIDAESNILRNPKDNHTKWVMDPSLHRDTDRMLFKAHKPYR